MMDLRRQLALQAGQLEELKNKLSTLAMGPVVPLKSSEEECSPAKIDDEKSTEISMKEELVSEYISDSEEESKNGPTSVEQSNLTPEVVVPSETIEIILPLDPSTSAKIRASLNLPDEVICSVPRGIAPDELVFEVILVHTYLAFPCLNLS